MPVINALTPDAVQVAGFWVRDEGATEQWGADSEATWTLLCNWADRIPLSIAIGGDVTEVGVVTEVTYPMPYPDADWLFGHAVKVEGVGTHSVGPNGMIAYEYARLTCTFRPKELTVSGEPNADGTELGEETLDFASEVISFNGAEPAFKWTDGKPLPPEATPGKIIPVIEFSKTKKGMLTIPYSALFAVAASPVNNNTFLGAPAGTLRFAGARTSRQFSGSGGGLWDMQIKLAYRPIPWNNMFRPSTGNFEAILTVNGNNPLYASSNFGTLGIG
jgi:hypothetical protein